MRDCMTEDDNNRNKINKLNVTLNKKEIQEEEHNMTTSSAEAFARMLLNDEKKKDAKRRECQGKLNNLNVDNNQ